MNSTWASMYNVSLNYPVRPNFQEIHNYKRYFTYMQYVLPASDRVGYANHYNSLDIDPYLTTRDYLFLWVLAMHNMENKDKNRPQLTKDEVMMMIVPKKTFRSGRSSMEGFVNPNKSNLVTKILFIALLIHIIFRRTNKDLRFLWFGLLATALLGLASLAQEIFNFIWRDNI